MTDPNELADRLEAVLDRLDRLGLAGPTPTPTTAVDPDGYPGVVVSGELVEAAWGNAVVAKLRDHFDQLGIEWMQSGNVVLTSISSGVFRIDYPEAFANSPAVGVVNGDTAATPQLFLGITATEPTHVIFTATTAAGDPFNSPLRVLWIAHGEKVGLA